MALLVTGAMGHVGYETARRAAERGIPVVAQYRAAFRPADAEALGDGVSWVRADLADPFEAAAMTAAHAIDGCIHAAAIANDQLGTPVPMRTFRSNVAATQHLLELGRQQGWRRFVFVSTGAVFQRWRERERAIPEDEPASPVTLYAGTKHCGETLTAMYRTVYGLDAATVRISWVFGPPVVPRSFEGPRGPVPELLRRALRGERIDEPSGGDFAASFTYVTDVALGLLAAYGAERLDHAVYHLGTGENHATSRVAEAVRRAVPGAEIRIGPGTEPWTRFTVPRGPLSCERMREDLGFAPTYGLDAAVREFADWMRAHPESYRP
ncbi:MAG TPA: NAD(P)-dependent oxidoreductase [Geminicoccaceae bacterium]|nr:NAD(P)-dependent oxidoreductase [Geminicoccaceae bacterium]